MNKLSTYILALLLISPAAILAFDFRSLTVTANVTAASIQGRDSFGWIESNQHPSVEFDIRVGRLISLTPSIGIFTFSDSTYGTFLWTTLNAGLGFRIWPFMPEKTNGLFCGFSIEEQASLAFQNDIRSNGSKFWLYQKLHYDVELGWQWQMTKHFISGIRLNGTLFRESNFDSLVSIFYPSLGFRLGWVL